VDPERAGLSPCVAGSARKPRLQVPRLATARRRSHVETEEERPMRAFTHYLTMNVPARMGFVNLTPDVEKAVSASGVREGLCLVNAMHITASVFINDDEPGLLEDYQRWLERLAPYDASPDRYHHNRTGEDNGDAHHKRQVMGREVVIAVTRGKLDFGPWEQIFYGEFDGRRAKRVLIKVIGD
jgi:secondary thiamine-phosphate synthase enzyme